MTDHRNGHILNGNAHYAQMDHQQFPQAFPQMAIPTFFPPPMFDPMYPYFPIQGGHLPPPPPNPYPHFPLQHQAQHFSAISPTAPQQQQQHHQHQHHQQQQQQQQQQHHQQQHQSQSQQLSSDSVPRRRTRMSYHNQNFVPQRDHSSYLPQNHKKQLQQVDEQSVDTSPVSTDTASSTARASSTSASSPQPESPKTAVIPTEPQSKEPNPLVSSSTDLTLESSKQNTEEDTASFSFALNTNLQSIKLPIYIGTTKKSFVSQKKTRTNKKQIDKKKKDSNILNFGNFGLKSLDSHQETDKQKPTTTEQDSQPISKPLKWSSIAEQAAKKTTPHNSVTPPISNTATTIKKEEKLVPSVSNVLEPLGVVTLKMLFDKNYKLSNSKKLPQIVPRGLVNTGNICFMSSIMQLLLYCQPFYSTFYLISTKTVQELGNNKNAAPLIEAIIEFFKNFNVKLDEKETHGDPFIPDQFYKEISINSRFQHLQWGQQEDAEEFFGYLLDGLHEEFLTAIKNLNSNDLKLLIQSISNEDTKKLVKLNLKKIFEDEFNSQNETLSNLSSSNTDDGWHEVQNSSKKKISAKRTVEVKPSPINQLFGGQFRSVLDVPKQKETQSITLDPFHQIQLDISDEHINTIEDAFKSLSEPEEISYKSNDKFEVTARKQTFIDKLPNVLIVHLKRFSFISKTKDDGNSYSKDSNHYINRHGHIEKLRKKVQYQHELVIPKECISSATKKFNSNACYKLIGVVYHHGISSEGGHYTVDVLNNDDNKWMRIDDTAINYLQPEDVVQGGDDDQVKTAYILMYQKAN